MGQKGAAGRNGERGDREDRGRQREGKKKEKEERTRFLERTRTRKACVVKNSRPKQKAERGETSEHRSALCFMPERVLNKRVMCLSVTTTTTTTITIGAPLLLPTTTTAVISTTSAAAATVTITVTTIGHTLYGRYTQPTHTYTPTPWAKVW